MKYLFQIFLLIVIAAACYIGYGRWQVSQLNNEGVRLLNEDREREAIAVLERAKARAPQNQFILRNLAEAYTRANETDKARALLEGGAVDLKSNATLQRNAELLKEDERLRANARARVERMKAEGWKNEENVTTQTIMDVAQMYRDMGDHAHVIMILERALFRDPDNLDLEARIEMHEKSLAEEKIREAEKTGMAAKDAGTKQ